MTTLAVIRVEQAEGHVRALVKSDSSFVTEPFLTIDACLHDVARRLTEKAAEPEQQEAL